MQDGGFQYAYLFNASTIIGLWHWLHLFHTLQVPYSAIMIDMSLHRHLLQEEEFYIVDIVEGTGVRENAWNFQNVI